MQKPLQPETQHTRPKRKDLTARRPYLQSTENQVVSEDIRSQLSALGHGKRWRRGRQQVVNDKTKRCYLKPLEAWIKRLLRSAWILDLISKGSRRLKHDIL